MNRKYWHTALIVSAMMFVGALGHYVMNAEAKSPTGDPEPEPPGQQLRIETKEIAPGVILIIAISPTGNCDIEVLDLRSETTVSQTSKK
jgi:hypothetical protein